MFVVVRNCNSMLRAFCCVQPFSGSKSSKVDDDTYYRVLLLSYSCISLYAYYFVSMAFSDVKFPDFLFTDRADHGHFHLSPFHSTLFWLTIFPHSQSVSQPPQRGVSQEHIAMGCCCCCFTILMPLVYNIQSCIII